MADAREDAITTLAGVMALIDVVSGTLDAALAEGDEDPWLAKAKVALAGAGTYVTWAATKLQSPFKRPDGSVTLVGLVVGWIPTVAPIGALAYLCRGPLHLATVWTALICIAALSGLSVTLLPAWRAVTARYVPRQFTAERAARRDDAGRGGSPLDSAACLEAVLRARNHIGTVAVGRLTRYAPVVPDAAGLVTASWHDQVLANLRSADGALASGYGALIRWQAGVRA